MDRYNKLLISLKYYCLGKGYHMALKALKLGLKHHTGMRKDNINPEFLHQVEIALFVITLKDLVNEEYAIVASLLHDINEDTIVTKEDISVMFNQEISDIVWKLTKKTSEITKDTHEYFTTLATCPIASIVKGSDRIHNVQSMIGVFSKEKQIKYLKEVDDHFLPMIKTAKANFPEQTHAYFNISHMLKSQSQLIRSFQTPDADK